MKQLHLAQMQEKPIQLKKLNELFNIIICMSFAKINEMNEMNEMVMIHKININFKPLYKFVQLFALQFSFAKVNKAEANVNGLT